MLSNLKKNVTNLFFHFTIDFEMAMASAITEKFLNAKIFYDLFQLGQCFYNKFKVLVFLKIVLIITILRWILK